MGEVPVPVPGEVDIECHVICVEETYIAETSLLLSLLCVMLF